MDEINKKKLSECDICTKFITPSIEKAGWSQSQFREEVKLTDGRIMVRGKLASRVTNPNTKGGPKRADYIIYVQPNVPIAVIEAKRNIFSIGHGMQQALLYAEMIDVPFAFSSNGDGFLFHDRTGITKPTERELGLEEFPKFSDLWSFYKSWKGLNNEDAIHLVEQPYHVDGSGSMEIEQYLKSKSRCSKGGNPAAMIGMKEHAHNIYEMTRSKAELSSVAKWCVLFRNDTRLSRLVA